MQGGVNGPLVSAENLYKTAKHFVNAMGFKNADDFVTDPLMAGPPPPPKPDPMVQAAQIKAQASLQQHTITTQQKQQGDAAELAMRERLGIAELQMKFQIEMAKLGLDGKRLELDWASMHHDHALKVAEKQHASVMNEAAHDLKRQKNDAEIEAIRTPEPGSLPEGPNAAP